MILSEILTVNVRSLSHSLLRLPLFFSFLHQSDNSTDISKEVEIPVSLLTVHGEIQPQNTF